MTHHQRLLKHPRLEGGQLLIAAIANILAGARIPSHWSSAPHPRLTRAITGGAVTISPPFRRSCERTRSSPIRYMRESESRYVLWFGFDSPNPSSSDPQPGNGNESPPAPLASLAKSVAVSIVGTWRSQTPVDAQGALRKWHAALTAWHK
jgi:hypothetical protein